MSLVGKWKLIRDGSDFMPGVDALKGTPMVLKLLGKAETEFFKIEKKRYFETDEICLTYVAKNVSMYNSYQLGTLNFESTKESETIFGMIQNCNELFTEFTIHRVGPGSGQISRETYLLDPISNEIKLELEVDSGEGLHIKMIKYLARFDAWQPNNVVSFKTSATTLGWGRHEFWPSSVLSDCKVLVVKAVKMVTCNTKTQQDNKVLNILWTREGFTGDFQMNTNSMARHQSSRQKDGEEVIIFLIQVSVSGVTWYVAHRYTEFDVLRSFLMHQNPYIQEFKDVDDKFPRKAVGLSFRKSVLERRIEGLGAFLVFFLRNSRFCRQTSVDAVCSFLTIPENLSVLALPATNRTPPPIRDAATAASLTTAAAAAARQQNAASKGANGAAPGAPGVGEEIDNSPEHILWTVLGKKGMVVIKHGRSGAPKQRILHCAPDGSLLYWGDKSSYKSVFLDEVQAIRLGLDIDPLTPAHLIPAPAPVPGASGANGAGNSSSAAPPVPPNPKSKHKSLAKSAILYGTETLRRNCKYEELALCFSLILPTRTFDIQCKTQEDYEKLLGALRAVCPPA